MNSQSVPKLTIIAGYNGSDKSTLTRHIQSNLEVPVIDPDAEARKINPSSPESVAVAAGKQAIRLALDSPFLDFGQKIRIYKTAKTRTIRRRVSLRKNLSAPRKPSLKIKKKGNLTLVLGEW